MLKGRVAEEMPSTRPIVGLQNGGAICNDSIIGPGEITLLDTFDIAPFTNFVSVIEDVAPADLVIAVEHGVEGLTDTEASFAPVVRPGRRVRRPAAGRQPCGRPDRRRHAVHGGRPAAGGVDPVDIATIDFLAAGNDGYDVFRAVHLHPCRRSYRQSLADILPGADLSADSVEYQPREDPALGTRVIPLP